MNGKSIRPQIIGACIDSVVFSLTLSLRPRLQMSIADRDEAVLQLYQLILTAVMATSVPSAVLGGINISSSPTTKSK